MLREDLTHQAIKLTDHYSWRKKQKRDWTHEKWTGLENNDRDCIPKTQDM